MSYFIIVGRDYERKNLDHAYLAFLDYAYNKEARGSTQDEAVARLRTKYPEAKDLPVLGTEGSYRGLVDDQPKASPKRMADLVLFLLLCALAAAVGAVIFLRIDL